LSVDLSSPTIKTNGEAMLGDATMSNNKKEMLRVRATLEDIKKSYGVMSKSYATLEGRFEKGLRRRGLELLDVKAGETILEIGVGTGFSLKEIASSVGEVGKAYGVDITPQMLQLTKERLEKAGLMGRVKLDEGDARQLPYEDGKFDAVYIAGTLELFDTPDIPKVLSEIKRVLKPTGRLGIASLSRESKENSLFLRFYEWLHQKIPKYASCRPIYVEQVIKDAGYKIVSREEFIVLSLAPFKLVVATPA